MASRPSLTFRVAAQDFASVISPAATAVVEQLENVPSGAAAAQGPPVSLGTLYGEADTPEGHLTPFGTVAHRMDAMLHSTPAPSGSEALQQMRLAARSLIDESGLSPYREPSPRSSSSGVSRASLFSNSRFSLPGPATPVDDRRSCSEAATQRGGSLDSNGNSRSISPPHPLPPLRASRQALSQTALRGVRDRGLLRVAMERWAACVAVRQANESAVGLSGQLRDLEQQIMWEREQHMAQLAVWEQTAKEASRSRARSESPPSSSGDGGERVAALERGIEELRAQRERDLAAFEAELSHAEERAAAWEARCRDLTAERAEQDSSSSSREAVWQEREAALAAREALLEQERTQLRREEHEAEAAQAQRREELAATEARLEAWERAESSQFPSPARRTETAVQCEASESQRDTLDGEREAMVRERDEIAAGQEALERAHVELESRRREEAERLGHLEAREWAVEVREKACGEKEALLVNRDAALDDRNKGLDDRERALSERERTLGKIEFALQEREKALTEREAALAEREKALDARQAAQDSREASVASREEVLVLNEQALGRRQGQHAEAEAALVARELAGQQKEAFLGKKDEALQQRHRELEERERRLAEREAALQAANSRKKPATSPKSPAGDGGQARRLQEELDGLRAELAKRDAAAAEAQQQAAGDRAAQRELIRKEKEQREKEAALAEREARLKKDEKEGQERLRQETEARQERDQKEDQERAERLRNEERERQERLRAEEADREARRKRDSDAYRDAAANREQARESHHSAVAELEKARRAFQEEEAAAQRRREQEDAAARQRRQDEADAVRRKREADEAAWRKRETEDEVLRRQRESEWEAKEVELREWERRLAQQEKLRADHIKYSPKIEPVPRVADPSASSGEGAVGHVHLKLSDLHKVFDDRDPELDGFVRKVDLLAGLGELVEEWPPVQSLVVMFDEYGSDEIEKFDFEDMVLQWSEHPGIYEPGHKAALSEKQLRRRSKVLVTVRDGSQGQRIGS